MPQPRHTQIDIDATPFYHCISRCVRRAFLCGTDRFTDRSFDHRKAWLVELLGELTSIFAIDLCAYAVLSNHYHLVLRVDGTRARAWSSTEVIERYARLFAPTVAAHRAGPKARLDASVPRWRARLYDLSWFMRCLNEAIARRANQEDDCTGRFWEGRFRSQALLDQAGLLTCMAYVDLNPVRAGLATHLVDSDFTSIQQRLAQFAEAASPPRETPHAQDPTDPDSNPDSAPCAPARPALWPFAENRQRGEDSLPITLSAYTELLTGTATCLRAKETGALAGETCESLESLGISATHWVESLRNYSRHFFAMVGAVHSIDVYCARTDRDRAKGRRWAAVAFRTAA